MVVSSYANVSISSILNGARSSPVADRRKVQPCFGAGDVALKSFSLALGAMAASGGVTLCGGRPVVAKTVMLRYPA
jgi:hypothetical protein